MPALLQARPPADPAEERTLRKLAIREAALHWPDVMAMDVQMPDLNGIDAARELA